jgi:hypothetical protein
MPYQTTLKNSLLYGIPESNQNTTDRAIAVWDRTALIQTICVYNPRAFL